MKVTDLKKYLKDKNEDELRDEIVFLFKTFPEIKEFYETRVNPDNETEILEKYKKIIKDEFYPDRGFGKLRYEKIRKAHSNFKKFLKTLFILQQNSL